MTGLGVKPAGQSRGVPSSVDKRLGRNASAKGNTFATTVLENLLL